MMPISMNKLFDNYLICDITLLHL